MEQKFVRLENSEVIIFPASINHSDFKKFNPISAGFCYIRKNRIDCFGESISLELKSDPKEDSLQATKQVFGIEAMLQLI